VKTEESWMIIHEPIPHWNNFTVPELKKILEHCKALERVGIAQDEEMMASIERDIKIRTKEISPHCKRFERKQVIENKEKENHVIIKKRLQSPEYSLELNI
jgi:hypothetical protein